MSSTPQVPPTRVVAVPAAPLLPVLRASSRGERLVSSVAIGVWAVLSVAVALRLRHHIDLWQWWVPLALCAGAAAADLASGLIHWGADTWGRADFPVIGARVLLPFRLHHVNPDDFLARRFLDTNGDVAALCVPALALLLVVPLETTWHHAGAIFGFALCAMGAMTNQIHQWAHMPSPPAAVQALQRLRLVLPADGHARHHAGACDAHYCITTGWCNRPLEALGFFRRLEHAITRVTGVDPRSDDWSGKAPRAGGARNA